MKNFKNLFLILLVLLSTTEFIYSQEKNMERKIIFVKEVKPSTPTPSISEVKELLSSTDINFVDLDCHSWQGYNYFPKVKFKIAYSKTEIYLQYVVTEDVVKADFGEDATSSPYKDSCVEFFAIPGEGGEYYNLELNCIGKGTFAGGVERTNRTKFGKDVLSKIRRESSLGSTPFGTKTLNDNNNNPYTWTLTIAIPIELYSLSKVKPLKGRSIRANFYKCGDDMPQSHYLSWNKIGTPRPNFHTPDYFGTLIFE